MGVHLMYHVVSYFPLSTMTKPAKPSKYTAAPWLKGEGFTTKDNGYCCQIFDAEGDIVCTADMIYGYKDSVEANARLIAAAPDLLMHLKDCCMELEAVWKSLGQKRSNSFVDDARKIISKAS